VRWLWTALIAAHLLSGPTALADDGGTTDEDDERAPPPESFIDDEPTGPTLGGPGPWDLHPTETPVQAGPWAVDRTGSAPNGVERDGSAREPMPAEASWGQGPTDPDAVEASPWAKTQAGQHEKLDSLGAHFPIHILGHEPDALLIELPLLIVQSPDQFDGQEYWLIVEFFLGKHKVADHRIWVSRKTLATMGPTHAWVKTMIPTPEPQGEIKVRILRMDPASSLVRPVLERSLKFGQ
jgi:hypothetical protein